MHTETMTQGDIDSIIGAIKARVSPLVLDMDKLNQVDIVVKDAGKPISPVNAHIYLNGTLLNMVKGMTLSLDASEPMAKVTLELWASYSVLNAGDTADYPISSSNEKF